MTFKETMAKLFSTSEGTYYKWKKENRPIIKLLEKYFNQDDLKEFLETGRIIRFERIEVYDYYFNEMIDKIVTMAYKSNIQHKFLSFISSSENKLDVVNEFQLDKTFVKLYDNKKINDFELISILKHKFPMDIYKFIELHRKDDFKQIEINLGDHHKWFTNYLRLLKLSWEHDIYDKLFNIDGPYPLTLIPTPPCEDNYHSTFSEDYVLYNKILIFIIESIKDNDLALLDKLEEYRSEELFSASNVAFIKLISFVNKKR